MENNELIVKNDINAVENVKTSGKTEVKMFTTIDKENVKEIYNLENASCDYKVNDVKGQKLRVVDVLIKEFVRELDEPVCNEQGEVIQEYEIKKICILIDDNHKTYVTASKIFTNQMLGFIAQYGLETIKNGLEIEITERPIKSSNNKGLGFKLV